MICIAGWKKISLILLIIVSIPFLIFQTQALALFGPEITDVTTKSFSVVWTTSSSYSTCGINLYTNSNYNTLMSLNPDQIKIVTYEGHPGKENNIAKVTVIGLTPGTPYYFRPVLDGSELDQLTVNTESFRGLYSNDPNDTDIVSNDVVHKSVYGSDGTSPVKGVLVLAKILDPQDPNIVLSDYPISGWTGEGMIGSESSTEYDPNDISYKQYAALEMNNLFGVDNFPLSLQGDNPSTPSNEGEIIEFIVVRGTQDVFGQNPTKDWFVSYGRVDSVDKIDGEKITTAKVSANFQFKRGLNPFTFPFKPVTDYTTVKLWNAIEAAQGKEGIIRVIFVFDRRWNPTLKLEDGSFYGERSIEQGQACVIIMAENMTKDITFYGHPVSASIELKRGINIIAIPQLPAYYQTKDLWKDIETSSGVGVNSVKSIFTFKSRWEPTLKTSDTDFYNSLPIVNTNIYAVIIGPEGTSVTDWVPFEWED